MPQVLRHPKVIATSLEGLLFDVLMKQNKQTQKQKKNAPKRNAEGENSFRNVANCA